MNHIRLTHMQYAYIMTQNFMAIFLPTNFFPTPPTQIFKYRFSLKCVGNIFFRPHIRIQNKILYHMICIDIGLSEIRLRKGGLIEIHLFTPTQSIWVYCWSLKIAPRCSEGLKGIINVQIIVLVMVEKKFDKFFLSNILNVH